MHNKFDSKIIKDRAYYNKPVKVLVNQRNADGTYIKFDPTIHNEDKKTAIIKYGAYLRNLQRCKAKIKKLTDVSNKENPVLDKDWKEKETDAGMILSSLSEWMIRTQPPLAENICFFKHDARISTEQHPKEPLQRKAPTV